MNSIIQKLKVVVFSDGVVVGQNTHIAVNSCGKVVFCKEKPLDVVTIEQGRTTVVWGHEYDEGRMIGEIELNKAERAFILENTFLVKNPKSKSIKIVKHD